MDEFVELTEVMKEVLSKLDNVTRRLKRYNFKLSPVENINNVLVGSQSGYTLIDVFVYKDKKTGKEYVFKHDDNMFYDFFRDLVFDKKVKVLEDIVNDTYYIEGENESREFDDIYHPTKPSLPGTYKVLLRRREMLKKNGDVVDRIGHQYCADTKLVQKKHTKIDGVDFGKWENHVLCTRRVTNMGEDEYYYKDKRIYLVDIH